MNIGSDSESPLKTTVHGVLLEIFDTGVLLIGESGLGKSEIALELLRRHHRLVADDAVVITLHGKSLLGEAPELSFEYIEIRGLGILNARELFGAEAVVRNTEIEYCIELIGTDDDVEPDRIGLETPAFELLSVSVPKCILPVGPGRNLPTLVETAVKLFLSRKSGSDSTRRFIEKHTALVGGHL